MVSSWSNDKEYKLSVFPSQVPDAAYQSRGCTKCYISYHEQILVIVKIVMFLQSPILATRVLTTTAPNDNPYERWSATSIITTTERGSSKFLLIHHMRACKVLLFFLLTNFNHCRWLSRCFVLGLVGLLLQTATCWNVIWWIWDIMPKTRW